MACALEMASAVGRVPAVIVAVMMAVGMAVVGMMAVGMMAVVILVVALVPARRNTPASAAEKRKNDGSTRQGAQRLLERAVMSSDGCGAAG